MKLRICADTEPPCLPVRLTRKVRDSLVCLGSGSLGLGVLGEASPCSGKETSVMTCPN
jgi:hypothetical protein